METTEQSLVTLAQQGRYVAAAVTLGSLWALESAAPMFAGREYRLSHQAANFGLAAINAFVSFGFASAVFFVTAWTRMHDFGLLHLAALPAWLQWIAALLLFDCWQYGWHRLNHRVPWLWRFHAVHHADAELDVSTGVRFHTGEIALSFLARLAVLPLLGITLPQLLIYEALALPVILFHHSNVRLPDRVDRTLRCLIVTPWMHCVHHSRWQPETDSNYASLLSIWDRLFGSFRIRENPREIALGLDEWTEREWRKLPGMLAAPFRKHGPRRENPPDENRRDGRASTNG